MITHYTSDFGLKSIIENRKIWFTDIRYLNDYNEVEFSNNKVRELIKEIDSEMISSAMGENIDSLFNLFMGMSHGYRDFVFCASLDNDNLPMWNYYSKGCDGYGIIFQKNKLIESLSCSHKELLVLYNTFSKEIIYDDFQQKENFLNLMVSGDSVISALLSLLSVENYLMFLDYIQKVLYPFYTDEMKAKLDEIFKNNLDDNKEKLKQIIEEEKKLHPFELNRFLKDIQALFFPINLFQKSSKFQYEKEFRIILRVKESSIPLLQKLGVYKTRLSNGLFIPYLEIPFDLNSINSIKISPFNSNQFLEKNIRLFLSDNKISPIIEKSNISVRF